MKKTISWVQPHYRNGSKIFNSYYLPYSSGILWSYIQKFQHLVDEYQLGEIIWKRDLLDVALDKIKHSDVVGFSTYVWNKNYNMELARRLKLVNPNCYIIFGGPDTPYTRADFLEKYPFIDCVVKQEGEDAFKQILENLGNIDRLKEIGGLVINDGGVAIDTGTGDRIQDINDIPSPFLTGFFDKILADNPDCNWCSVLEPDRGCPYQCTFCDWGSLTYSKIKKFDLQRVYDEIEWFGKNKISFMMIANANFGIFPERDNLIADKILEVIQRYGYPTNMYISWAKNQKRDVIMIAKKLEKLTGLSVSLQSMTEGVLETIKRSNLEINKIEEVFKICAQENVPVHTELILGLPGESLQTWKETVWKLFKAGNHSSISFYQTQILENSEMNLLQRRLYGIKSVQVRDFLAGSEVDEEVDEVVNTVIETKDMPLKDMIEALMFNVLVNTFHVNGITTYVARLLNKLKGIEYGEFYDRLLDRMMLDEWFKQEWADTRSYYEKWTTYGEIGHPDLGTRIEINGLNLNQRMTIKIILDSKNLLPRLMGIVRTLAEEYVDDNDLLDELFILQNNYFIEHHEIVSYPRQLQFNYDFIGYLVNDTMLKNTVTYKFEFRGPRIEHIDIYCSQMYTNRRNQLNKAKITIIP